MSKPVRGGVCSLCQETIEPENYFLIKIRSDSSRIGSTFNACRECLVDFPTVLPRSELTEEEKEYFSTKYGEKFPEKEK